jgi:endonuclease/exonuclease/phosphatase family metal-dependent hydrolase
VTLRVATFNVHHGAPPHGDVDLDATIETCRSLDADVLGLQELDDGAARSGGVDQPATIADALGMHLVFAPTVSLRGGGRYGHAVLSRRPLRDVEVLELTWMVGREPRVAIIAAWSGDDIDASIASAHLHNEQRGDPQPPLAILQLEEMLATLVRRPGPWIALGDLNLHEAIASGTFEDAGLRRVDTPPTIPSDRPRMTLDHIAVAGLPVLDMSVPSTTVSDHRPVVVDLGERQRPPDQSRSGS